MTQETQNQTGGGTALVLSNDLFFSMRIRDALRTLGMQAAVVTTEAEFGNALNDKTLALALIDFNHTTNWDTLSLAIADSSVAVIAFGPHKDTAGFAAARRAGVTRVISNSAFTASLPDLVQKYAGLGS